MAYDLVNLSKPWSTLTGVKLLIIEKLEQKQERVFSVRVVAASTFGQSAKQQTFISQNDFEFQQSQEEYKIKAFQFVWVTKHDLAASFT